jgi:hypothetical protein
MKVKLCTFQTLALDRNEQFHKLVAWGSGLGSIKDKTHKDELLKIKYKFPASKHYHIKM